LGTYATSTDVSTLRDALSGYVSAISYSDDSDTETVLQAQAQLALDKWADAQLAIINVNASSATSYGSAIGNSFTKRRLDELEAAARRHMEDFRRVCALGGVTVPTFEPGIALWDMSGVSSE